MQPMNLKITTEPLTLRTDAAGVVRVGDTRVSLDTVIRGYLEGSIPEEIVEQFPSLQVAHGANEIFNNESRAC